MSLFGLADAEEDFTSIKFHPFKKSMPSTKILDKVHGIFLYRLMLCIY
jgi:hypothetical protein